MDPVQKLTTFLNEIIQAEGSDTREVLAGYIVGELLGDYDNIYEELRKNNPKVERIADLAGNLEWSNGSEEELQAMWQELKKLAEGIG